MDVNQPFDRAAKPPRPSWRNLLLADQRSQKLLVDYLRLIGEQTDCIVTISRPAHRMITGSGDVEHIALVKAFLSWVCGQIRPDQMGNAIITVSHIRRWERSTGSRL